VRLIPEELPILRRRLGVLVDRLPDGPDVVIAPALMNPDAPDFGQRALRKGGWWSLSLCHWTGQRITTSCRHGPCPRRAAVPFQSVSLDSKPVDLIEHPLQQGFRRGRGDPGPLQLEDFPCAGARHALISSLKAGDASPTLKSRQDCRCTQCAAGGVVGGEIDERSLHERSDRQVHRD
jgi:hypothetical protein